MTPSDRHRQRAGLLLSCLVLIVIGLRPVAAASIDFTRQVLPILRDNCWECHGAKEQKGSIRLDRREHARSEAAKGLVVPGAPDKSSLYLAISGIGEIAMPEEGSLSAEQISTVRQWIEEGATWPEDAPEFRWTPDARLDALTAAVRRGDARLVRKAVGSSPELVTARDSRGATLLIETAAYGNRKDVRWLLARRADPNARDAGGRTPLMLAIDDAAKVKLLLDAGAEVSARSEAGRSALQLALDLKWNEPVLRLLVAHGALDGSSTLPVNPLVQVSRNGDLPSMTLLAKEMGQWPKGSLQAAALSGCSRCLERVIESGPSREEFDKALSAVVLMGSNASVKRLLQAGADANVVESSPVGNDGDRRTALIKAVYSDFADVERVRLLLDHGARVNAPSTKGNTALREARKKGQTDIVALLAAAGAED